MNKTKVSKRIAQPAGGDYISIKAFQQFMSRNDSPYHSTFSFGPFFRVQQEDESLQQLDQSSTVFKIMNQFEQQLATVDNENLLSNNNPEIGRILSLLFPALFFRGQIGFVGTPISKKIFFLSPALEKLFASPDWEVRVPDLYAENLKHKATLEAAELILAKFYDYQLPPVFLETLIIRNRKTKLEKHYKVHLVKDYINVKPIQPLKELSQEKINELLNDWDNAVLWKECFPYKNFQFEGLIIGTFTDVTDVGILSMLKERTITGQDDAPEEEYQYINQLVRSYLEMPDLNFGTIQKRYPNLQKYASWSLLGDEKKLVDVTLEDLKDSCYEKALFQKEPVIIGDLLEWKNLGIVERKLIDKGFRSLMIVPLIGTGGQHIGVFELGDKKPFQFNSISIIQMQEFIDLFSIGTTKWLEGLSTMVNLHIQKQYTSIHDSVKWKFEEVARKQLWTKTFERKEFGVEPIVFPDVYPLYGQADIVGSSRLRNESIQADLIDNLERVNQTMSGCLAIIDFQLLDTYLTKTTSILDRLKKGGYVSSDESQIVDLLTLEIHPLLRDIQVQFNQIPPGILATYFDYLNPKLNIVYRRRKAYEESVSELNKQISEYVETEDAKRQKILPHYFEKYTTDGLEYNLYVGQSLLRNGKFSSFFLKDFRLWQLLMMCEITRLVAKLSKEMPVALTTAQLIFVYNTPLSIRFHMEEKQFDVDGAYNVRYEILKKRIDKAYIKGTKERLTLTGKIAIVWLQEKDREEYLQYLKHLVEKKYITDNIEELELEKLQGADGLKALRVTVVV